LYIGQLGLGGLSGHDALASSATRHRVHLCCASYLNPPSEMAVRVTNDALQMHGAHGYMTDSPVQRYFRDARMLTISEGSSEIQHINLARGLGLKADDYYA